MKRRRKENDEKKRMEGKKGKIMEERMKFENKNKRKLREFLKLVLDWIKVYIYIERIK